MCGIFGLIVKPGAGVPVRKIKKTLVNIAVLSESRGKDSSGIAIRKSISERIDVIKGDIPIRSLVRSRIFRKEVDESLMNIGKGGGFAALGHARLVTNGSQLNEVNNQPVLKDEIVLVHNGIIVNADELWARHTDIHRAYRIDTEIIPALLRKELHTTHDLTGALNRVFNQLEGTWSVAMMFQDLDQFVLATNTGSLYYITDSKGFIVFASEGYFLERLKHDASFAERGGNAKVHQLPANKGMIIHLSECGLKFFDTTAQKEAVPLMPVSLYRLKMHSLENNKNRREVVIDPSVFINRAKESHLYKMLEYNADAISKLRRCTRCLLPETFPYIDFDHLGVCNYCNHYKPQPAIQPIEKLKSLVEPYRSKDGRPDCIVPFSGGRDSTYSLHIVKRELGMNTIEFTYDWGMVTDLARRNIARVCGKLGVENIIVSADIHWKRENIRKNVKAWLKSPSLGMIPLFMAGDKFFFYYTNQVKKQTGIDLNIWGINNLENTEFKVGFAGLKPQFDKKRIYSLSIANQLKLFGYVGGNILRSPGYLNQSVFDSLGSFASRYISPKKDYYHLFDYYRWDENEINDLIQHEYKWETAIDTKSTWRIGDGTASFYNYIYYTVAGFSENDTFRSNQIREGMLTREQAMALIEEDNRPRYETLRWYLEIIGLDFAEVVRTVNAIPKLYPL
ncbi:MAG: glucosamine 6-phosphate synthetase [Chitinophagaceae bacterium]|nr:glucosamine 6-phosphate synthetase [Chitinophagaceae bacterium]